MTISSATAKIGRTLADSVPYWPERVKAPKGSPNVLVVLFDDVGFSDFGCYGSPIKTPTIDALAGEGLRYTGFHTTADDAADRTDYQHRGDQCGHCPRQEAMGGVAKVHLIAMHIGPLHPQPTGDVTAQARSDDLGERQPDNRGNAKALGADTAVRPRRHRRKAQAEAQQYQDQ